MNHKLKRNIDTVSQRLENAGNGPHQTYLHQALCTGSHNDEQLTIFQNIIPSTRKYVFLDMNGILVFTRHGCIGGSAPGWHSQRIHPSA